MELPQHLAKLVTDGILTHEQAEKVLYSLDVGVVHNATDATIDVLLSADAC